MAINKSLNWDRNGDGNHEHHEPQQTISKVIALGMRQSEKSRVKARYFLCTQEICQSSSEGDSWNMYLAHTQTHTNTQIDRKYIPKLKCHKLATTLNEEKRVLVQSVITIAPTLKNCSGKYVALIIFALAAHTKKRTTLGDNAKCLGSCDGKNERSNKKRKHNASA